MKKIFLVGLLCCLGGFNAPAMTVAPGYRPNGLALSASLSRNNISGGDGAYFTWNIIEWSIFPSSERISGHLGLLTQFSADVSIFDIYCAMGFTLYPWRKIFSVSGNFGITCFAFYFNHFSYLADVKMNMDIPLRKGHALSFGIGLRHRNSLRLLNWLGLSNGYYAIYNSYFFEMGYRYIR